MNRDFGPCSRLCLTTLSFDAILPIMAGICSMHRHREAGCNLCEAMTPEEEELYLKKAALYREQVGVYVCDCGFEYYRTVDSCPLCYKKREIIIVDGYRKRNEET